MAGKSQADLSVHAFPWGEFGMAVFCAASRRLAVGVLAAFAMLHGKVAELRGPDAPER